MKVEKRFAFAFLLGKSGNKMKRIRKITILGAGNVGATVAYTLATDGMCSEIVLVDINKDKAEGEVMDISQGLAFSPAVKLTAGDYSDAAGSDIVIVTIGAARKAGQSRIDLAQGNVNLIKNVMPQVVEYSPNAIYVVVSNPVDIITYAILKYTSLSPNQVIGTGTLLDASRLRTILASRLAFAPSNVHAYVFGEHGDSSVVPWSLITVSSVPISSYCEKIGDKNFCSTENLEAIEDEVRKSGGVVIQKKQATYYAIAMSVRHLCECLLRNASSILTVSSLLTGQYGISDVCMSLPFVVNSNGVGESIEPPLLESELMALHHSAEVLKNTLNSIEI